MTNAPAAHRPTHATDPPIQLDAIAALSDPIGVLSVYADGEEEATDAA